MLTTGEERETEEEEEEEEEEEGEGSDGRALFPFLLRRLSCERKRTEDFPGGGEWATELKLSLSLSLFVALSPPRFSSQGREERGNASLSRRPTGARGGGRRKHSLRRRN